MAKNAYELTLEFISVMGDIDNLLDDKTKAENIADIDRLNKEIDRKEARLFELKNLLKKVEV